MSGIQITPDIVRAAAQDAGNRSMRAAGRLEWNIDDWQAAAKVFDRLCALDDETEATKQ